MREIGGPGYLDALNALRDIAPDLVEFAIGFAYGDVMSRPGLDLKTRQLCNVAALAVMPHAVPQLTYHINGALNVGWRPGEILDVLRLAGEHSHASVTASSRSAARSVFAARGISATAAAPLDDRTKELTTVAALTALGTERERLQAHIRAALDAGATREHVIEVIQQMVVYAGFPAALNGIAAARQALEEHRG